MSVSSIDQTSLLWIKPEIDACLSRAAEALERYADNDFKGDSVASAQSELREVRGVLRILELYGAALVAEEMELLLGDIVSGRVSQVEDALTSLLRAALQLPDYLERLQAGSRDVPIVLLPLLNDLRSCRGEKLLSESVLLIPPSDPELPADLPYPQDRLTQGEFERYLVEWRREWQLILLEWFRGSDQDHVLSRLVELCDELLDVLTARPARKLWWIASAVVEALRERLLDTSISSKLLFGRLDREVKRLIDQGERLYGEQPPDDLIRSLLYYVAQAGSGGQRIGQVRSAFNLDDLLPSAEEIDSARGVMSGRNNQLLASVAGALEEELLRVKDALDLFLRGNRGDPASLQSELPILDRVADTLGILGMGVERDQVQSQRVALAGIVAGDTTDENALLDIASGLLRVEQSLQAQRSGIVTRTRPDAEPIEPGRLTGVERQRLIEAALKEAALNLQQSKELFVAELAVPVGSQHHDAARMMRDVAGALRLLEFEGAAERALALAGFLHEAAENPQPLNNEQVVAYADALSGVEYYLELVADHQGHDDLRLDSITDAIARLGHWPPVVSLRQLFDRSAPTAPMPTPEAETGSAAGVEPVTPAASFVEAELVAENEELDAPAAVLTGGDLEPALGRMREFIDEAGYGFVESNTDDDIRDTFLDELVEEIGQLEVQLPLWRQAPDDLERLRSIRRSFHTIKGSGRMVGAKLLGEFAWQVENLLNRVLNGHRQVSTGVIGLVEQAAATLPEFHAALCGDLKPRRDIAAIMAAAQLLSEGQEPGLPVHDAGASVPAVAEAVAVDPAETEFDPVLLEILRSEVAGHLGVIDTYLQDARDNWALAPVPEHLLRAAHTLNGAFGAVELVDVIAVTVPFEAYVRRLRGLRQAPDGEGHKAIAQVSDWLAQVVDRLDNGQDLPDPQDLSARFERLLSALPPVREDNSWLIDDLRASDSVVDGDGDVADSMRDLDSATADTQSLVADSSPSEPLTQVDQDSDLDSADALAPDPVPTHLDRSESSDSTFVSTWQPDAAIVDDAQQNRSESEELSDPAGFVAEAPGADDATVASDDASSSGYWSFESETSNSETSSMDVASAQSHDAGDADQGLAGTDPATPTADEETVAWSLPQETSSQDKTEEFDADTLAASTVDGGVLGGLLASLPSTPPDDVDPDLADFFREEARELLDRCEQHLANRDRHGDELLAQELARELHTLKGGARMAGFVDAGELAHVMESLLENAATDKRRFEGSEIALVGRCLDRLNHLIFPSAEPVVADPVVASPEPVHTRPAQPAEPESVTEVAPVETPSIKSNEAPAETAGDSVPAVRPDRLERLPIPEKETIAETAVGEFVRVRADQLDALVNLAGEVGIIRTRLEQQVGAFRFNLEELEQTVQRLREQMRKLEIEAETQILSREVRVQERPDQLFDPLEMDRFSQLQQLSRALAESMSDLQSIQGLLEEHTRLAESLLLQQSRAGAELQEGLMRARMVPFESVLPRLRRLVRQEGDALGKRVRLGIDGGQGELDRGVLERMAAPFEHMLRNALVHGLESPEERRRAGKDEEGEIRIRVARQATEVIIEVIDDGRGIDPDRVRSTAIARGLLAPESDLSDRDLFGFIMEPGFSTADALTQYAGRGVGLDVVASEIKQLGGSLSIDSAQNAGTTFSIRLPYTLAVSQAVLVRVGEHTFAVPMAGVQGIVRLAHGNYVERMAESRPRVEYAGEDYELFELDGMLGLPAIVPDENTQVPLLMIRAGDLRAALRVDSLLGGREIVVKPVGPQLARIPGVFGATILGDGAVVVILDIAVLLRRAAARRERGEVSGATMPVPVVRARPLVLVVDDSITMRKVSARVLEREGYEVHSAKDGLDALEQMHERIPDLILLDLEMPRMDGYEFAGYVRGDARFQKIPIIVITSRVGEKHRARAFELGVNRYLGKPYQEIEMISSVAELLAERADGKAGGS